MRSTKTWPNSKRFREPVFYVWMSRRIQLLNSKLMYNITLPVSLEARKKPFILHNAFMLFAIAFFHTFLSLNEISLYLFFCTTSIAL